ncbi:hypothetical protein FB45DRAFT_1067710 [Roridomyces roridus]|uniref:Uncharacterized protein n=1 Tax=Roridomyces roridus TaxID=1738132 RepID=A0AAD7B2P3_9AGAR|nr:hypothetical protein FB45DRAFT_1067710 [Roridomyces roridus]
MPIVARFERSADRRWNPYLRAETLKVAAILIPPDRGWAHRLPPCLCNVGAVHTGGTNLKHRAPSLVLDATIVLDYFWRFTFPGPFLRGAVKLPSSSFRDAGSSRGGADLSGCSRGLLLHILSTWTAILKSLRWISTERPPSSPHAMNAAAGGVGGASAVPSRLGLCIWLSAFQPARESSGDLQGTSSVITLFSVPIQTPSSHPPTHVAQDSNRLPLTDIFALREAACLSTSPRRRHWLSAAAATTLVAEIPAGLGRIWSVAQVKGLGAAPLLRPLLLFLLKAQSALWSRAGAPDAAFTVGDLLVAVALFAAILAGLV